MKLKKIFSLTVLILSTSAALYADKESGGNHFYIEADLLYWNAHISSLELSAGRGSIVVETDGASTTTFTNELDVDPHFKWKAGYRIGAAYQFNCSPWTLGTLWTHFQDSGTKKITSEENNVNTTKCRVKFNQIDLVVAYDSASNFCVNFKPFLGIRGAKIHQGLQAFLVTDILYMPNTMATSTISLDDRQDYSGIGPVLGSQGIVPLGRGFSLYGTAAAALLYGNYKVHFQDSNISTSPISKSFFSQDQKHLHAFDPNITLALGIRWKLTIRNRTQMALKLSFEHQQYFNESYLGVNRGDLTFDGGVFGFDLFF